MDVLIRLERATPPAGTLMVVRPGPEPTAAETFAGWLGLIRALEAILREPTSPPAD